MQDEWIQMRTNLARDLDVLKIARILDLDEYGVVGRLHAFWSWADEQTSNGNAPSVTNVWIDRYINTPGFADALVEVGWLIVREDGIEIPDFDAYMSHSAKKRALTRKRVARHRNHKRYKSNAPSVTLSVTEALPEVEVEVDQDQDQDLKPPIIGLEASTREGQPSTDEGKADDVGEADSSGPKPLNPNAEPQAPRLDPGTGPLARRIEEDLGLPMSVTGIHQRHLDLARKELDDEEIVVMVSDKAPEIRGASNPWSFMVGLREPGGVLFKNIKRLKAQGSAPARDGPRTRSYERPACPNCGRRDVKRDGETEAGQKRWFCNQCRVWYRDLNG